MARRRDPEVGYYLVVCFNLLGQRGSLSNLRAIPSRGTDADESAADLRAKAARVLLTRRTLTRWFDAGAIRRPDLSPVPPRDPGGDEHCQAMNSIYDALAATCATGLILLAEGIPCRAGIEVGLATRIANREIYGPALERAIRIESRVAEHPRFVVGPDLLDYLADVESQSPQPPQGLVANDRARRCKMLLFRDRDGQTVLDFAGRAVREEFGAHLGASVKEALAFAEAQHGRLAEAGCEKLAGRYVRLLEYLRSRAPVWQTGA